MQPKVRPLPKVEKSPQRVGLDRGERYDVHRVPITGRLPINQDPLVVPIAMQIDHG